MEIILASYNRDKAREIEKIVSPVRVKCLADLGYDIDFDAVEDGQTYRENALKKVRAAAGFVDGIVVADDSGLEVQALGGRPGVASARYGGADSGYARQCDLLLEEMKGVPEPERGARFVCVVAVRLANGEERCFTGECRGVIATKARGESGFGYDPVFLLPDRGLTIAEISPEEKNKISHRGMAFRKLREALMNSSE